MHIGQNGPLKKFTRFLFMRLNVACITNIWHDKGHYKLDHSFSSTARIPFEPPPTFSIIALIFYLNEYIDDVFENFDIIYSLSHGCSSSS